jgi:hypothetical protein
VALRAGDTDVTLAYPDALSLQVVERWYSPSYGVRVPCRALAFTADAEVGTASRWRFTFQPEGHAA